MNNKIDLIISLNLDGKAENIIRKYIKQLESDKLEMAKAIGEVADIQERTYGSGMDLHLDMITYADENKELFEKANKYIKEVEK